MLGLRVHLDESPPTVVTFDAGQRSGPYPHSAAAHDDLTRAGLPQVEPPRRSAVGACVGREDDEPVAVAQVEDRRGPRLSAAPADGLEHQYRRAREPARQ